MTIRLDSWALTYPKYVSPGVHEATGYVLRGMHDEDKAREYAVKVREFFKQNALDQPVFVIRGPTSVTRAPYEVVSETCGYTVVYRAG